MNRTETSGNQPSRRGEIFVFLFFFAVYALAMPGVSSGGDAYIMYMATESVVDREDVFVQQEAIPGLVTGINNRPVSKFDIGQSLAEIPAYRLGRALGKKSTILPDEFMKYFATSFTGPAVSAAAMTIVFMLCCDLGYGFVASLAVVFLIGLCSIFWPHARLLFSEPMQALSLAGAVFSIRNFRRGGGVPAALAGGFYAGMGCATKSALILTIPFFAMYFAGGLRGYKSFGKKFSSVAVFTASLAMWAAVMLMYNYARYGDAFATGYMRPDNREGVYKFSVSLLTGAHGLLFSSGKGLVFYCPLVVFSAFAFPRFLKRNRAEGLLIAAIFVAMLVPFSKWGLWHGDYTWGPRFLVPAVPLLLLPMGEYFAGKRFSLGGRPAAAALSVVVALSLLLQVMGVFVNYNEYITLVRSQVPFDITFDGVDPGRLDLRDNMLSLHYVPEFSPIAGHWWILKHIIADRGLKKEAINKRMQKDFPWKTLAPYAVPPEPSRTVMIDCWWYYFSKYFPRSGGWAMRLAGLLGAAGVLSGGVLVYYVLAAKRAATESR